MRAFLAVLSVCAMCFPAFADGLPRSTPEEQGISSEALLKYIEAIDKIDAMNSAILVRHGHVVAEGWWKPYTPEERHMMYSLSKSFTSTAVGLAIAEGKLSLDDTVLSFFPEDAPEKPSENLKAMRVRDLLSMSTGHHQEELQKFSFTATDEPLTKKFLSLEVAHKPGTFFLYNTPGTYMCSAIVEKVTGEKVLDYLRPRLFEPLAIEDPVWGDSPQGITLGGTGLYAKTEDIAKFGLLYLNKGEWKGKQLLTPAWIEAATARQVSNGSNPASDWEQGYGYQFWRCRHGLYRGDGAFGQFCIVMPQYDAVLAITSGVKDMQAVMNAAWDHLLPAMQSEPLPANEAANRRLKEKLASLVVAPPNGSATSPTADRVSGKIFRLSGAPDRIQWIQFNFKGSEPTIVLGLTGGEQRVLCGNGTWPMGDGHWMPNPDPRSAMPPKRTIAASGAWTSDDTYTVKICLVESPYYLTSNCRFVGDAVTIESEYNVAFGEQTKQWTLVGRAE